MPSFRSRHCGKALLLLWTKISCQIKYQTVSRLRTDSQIATVLSFFYLFLPYRHSSYLLLKIDKLPPLHCARRRTILAIYQKRTIICTYNYTKKAKMMSSTLYEFYAPLIILYILTIIFHTCTYYGTTEEQ